MKDIASLFPSYAQQRDLARRKTVTVQLGDAQVEFSVRMPIKAEIDAMHERIQNPEPALVQAIFQRASSISSDFTEDNARDFAIWQLTLAEHFNLLDFQGERLTYEEISQEFNEDAQLAIMTAVRDAIKPDYDRLRGK